jgi:dihydrofolate reductase
MTPIVLVAACGLDRELGANNALLWHLPEDLAHFKRLTLGKPVLMGRRTWDSLPERFRPLPGRRNLVLTRGDAPPGAEAVRSLDDALARCSDANELCVIGGAQVYELAWARAKRLELTEVQARFPQADCHLPALDPAWQAVQETEWLTGANGLRYRHRRLERSAV